MNRLTDLTVPAEPDDGRGARRLDLAVALRGGGGFELSAYAPKHPRVYLRLNDASGSRYYIDPRTARIVGTYSARNWVSRWLYHGLHSLDLPWLYNHRPLWDIVVIALMLGGTTICVTSIVLSWRVLARKLAAILRTRFRVPNEDLVLEDGDAIESDPAWQLRRDACSKHG